MPTHKKTELLKGIFYEIAHRSGRMIGHGKRAADQLGKIRKTLASALTQGLTFYCFLTFSVYLLRLSTPDHKLPSAEKIKRRFKNVLPEDIADKLSEIITSQKRLSDALQAQQIEQMCKLVRRTLPLESKQELLKLLIVFFHVDGVIESDEIAGLRWIAAQMGVTPQAFDRLFSTIAPNASIIDKNSFYEILGIDKSATSEQIHKAYRKMAGLYHPDRFATQTAEVQQKAHNHFLEINKAFRRLKT